MNTLVFYVSGHGFGHASRDIEVLNAFGASEPSTRLIVRTAAAKWLFDLTVRVPHEFAAGETDTGVVQRDSLSHDIPETLRRAAAFYRSFDARVACEAEWLRRVGATFVVGDIPPLACAAAAQAGVPSSALGNFTWDWIYEDYLSIGESGDRGIGESIEESGIVERIAGAYSQAREGWRLPMHGGFASFCRIVDVPFVARHSRREPADTRRAFGLPLDKPVILSSFGGYGLGGLPLEQVDCRGDYAVVVAEATARGATPQAQRGPDVFALEDGAIYSAGFRYEDLVRAADVVVTKPGFGIIAECLANDTALVYTSRGRFREYPVLVAEMPQFLRCAFIEQADLFAGRWRASVERALSAPSPPKRPATNGAEHVAELIRRALPAR